jgi:hypothetical protein
MYFLQGELSLKYKAIYLKIEKKKGVTLIELVVAISISILIITMLTYEINRTSEEYNHTILETSQHFYINEAFRFIEVNLKDLVKEVSVSNDVITLSKYTERNAGMKPVYSDIDFNSIKIESIRLEGEEVKITYEPSLEKVALLKDVAIFTVQKFKDKLFISIQMKRGLVVKKCFDLSFVKN